ncbi:preprotein translocase subunit YajC [Streptomyces filamentosus]|uniref:Preprotein translocase subunit YajC n=2 Tax=Streptomyces filamentosus TaxID=67294 RepID=A0ABY4V409_STRFL|nr:MULTISPECIES: preprotein translocase subunit YajC [Streptomyces]MYR77472.1 preprotein translocase subunit YajC [Streptomyces sp. SID5466]EFE73244.1 secreted protein [Streptomyces filamentosus NRRL 15998]ESU49647.1 putative secreted protein [Streptomyces sp. HCCB10043]EWS90460.1 secreted protein [Streptomyces filamentosus NRRL 11379]USC50867.1 preprotein translocase subunit YajC [Streptomyces filamentosus]
MDLITLLPFIVLIGAMFLMTRSAKKKQAAAAQMRNDMQPGTGVRTIGGMYATVKEVHDDTVLLEVAPGVHAVYAKNAIGAVLDDAEYNRIVHGDDQELDADSTVVPDDASSLTGDADAEVAKIDLGKDDAADDAGTEDATAKDATAKDVKDAKGEGKTDGDADSK